MLKESSKIMTFYLGNTVKSILGFNHRKNRIISVGKKEVLDPSVVPKFKNQLEKPGVYYPVTVKKKSKSKEGAPDNSEEQLYLIDIIEFEWQVLPEGFPKTTVTGFRGLIKEPRKSKIRYAKTFPGGTFEAERNVPVRIKWKNMLSEPVSIYLHGGDKPLHHNKQRVYLNNREAAAYWYHARRKAGLNRNCFGIAGIYLIKENKINHKYNLKHMDLPGEKYSYPIIIQDCSFYTDGSFVVPGSEAKNPYGFFGNMIMVNGKVWPNLNVERRQYRFYIVNASVSRFYNLKLSNGMDFTVLGGDMGLLPSPVRTGEILLSPGERAEVLIDFSRLPTGTRIILTNDAQTPYPGGEKPDPETMGQIMRFIVPEYESISVAPMKLPEKFYEQPGTFLGLPKEVHTIHEEIISNHPILMLDGKECISPVRIKPVINGPKEWHLVNLTGKACPVQFSGVKCRIINRQKLDAVSYKHGGKNVFEADSLIPYLMGDPYRPAGYELGWKDTLRADPETVTRIAVFPYDY